MKIKNVLALVLLVAAVAAPVVNAANVDVKQVAAAAKQAGADKAAGVFEGAIAQSNKWVAEEVSTVFKAVLNGSSLYPYLPAAYEAYTKRTTTTDAKVANTVALLKALEKALQENAASATLASVVDPLLLSSLERMNIEKSVNQLGVNTNGPVMAGGSTVQKRRESSTRVPTPVTPAPISPQN
ncbi:MAG: hypothetical protein Q4F30_00355 [Akkermansia sp.]|nr:hypothetical protein [Akkermansia sp.]